MSEDRPRRYEPGHNASSGGLIARLPEDLKDRLLHAFLWFVMLPLAWSLPVLGILQNQWERERMESGLYYQPKLPSQAPQAVTGH